MPEHSQEPYDNPPIYAQSIQFRKFHMQSINPGAIPQNLTIPGQPRITAKTARNPPRNNCTIGTRSWDAWHNQFELHLDCKS